MEWQKPCLYPYWEAVTTNLEDLCKFCQEWGESLINNVLYWYIQKNEGSVAAKRILYKVLRCKHNLKLFFLCQLNIYKRWFILTFVSKYLYNMLDCCTFFFFGWNISGIKNSTTSLRAKASGSGKLANSTDRAGNV